MINVRVYITVEKQTDKMQSSSVFTAGCDIFPCFTFKQLTAFNGFGNQFCPLAEYLPGAKGIVSDFTVAHIIVSGQTDCCAVCLQADPRILLQ